ncbi:putative ENT domain-containing protein [Helianthus anomalus]
MRFKKGSKVKVMNKEVRVSCHDDRWIPAGKVLRNIEVEPSYSMTIRQKKVDCLPVYNDVRFKNSKRASPFRSSNYKAKKVKRAEKDCGRSQSQRHSFEKVDAFEGKEYTQESFNCTLNGYYKTENKKRKTYESDNDQCSVGSCSVLSDGYNNKLSSHSDVDILSSDGESFITSRVEHEVAASVHRLELHAYRSTLEALYASGPLSWEKEAVLTNLRISLHISNDEHLTELKHLISSGSRILD